MDIPPATLVRLALDPTDYALRLDEAREEGAPASGVVVTRAHGNSLLRFTLDVVDAHPRAPAPAAEPVRPSTHTPSDGDPSPGTSRLTVTRADDALSVPDTFFLLSVLWLTEHHADAFRNAGARYRYVDVRTGRALELPHPPRIETSEALLAALPVATRVRVLLEACTLAVPVWSAWTGAGDVTYYDGVMAMASLSGTLAESTIGAVARFLDDGAPEAVQQRLGEYTALHWPMMEDNLSIPPNVYYSLFAPRNLAECALHEGDLEAARVCIQQATAARATNAEDEFLGEPFRKAFLLGWWRACVHVLCGEPVPALERP